MTKHIDTITWLVLALVAIAVKFFLLPDTVLMIIFAIVFVGACGAGALFSLNKMHAEDHAALLEEPTRNGKNLKFLKDITPPSSAIFIAHGDDSKPRENSI